ncbi:Sec-independent protein translocase TatB [Ameyamaea chiangmaiensis NBRC 103196]|uniref:Sec-independent protein translocase protein TatB n=1 Tax=Ameyamaea chiangmaiensis TaxID=442969 RepID=A0A850PGV8_9PROT|nr:Sec-independent protein translocase protein TatB [Ameyamaea chiangmaiensis]MBS4075744.1 twin-arginine translocase subunit TatB [Ameyamaea chiangmaiensis]NVN41889.1 twin-arginine translocase subunit TatB [Ameyamaea chiangmaiensis]GBQ70314.1 Sec-independent protein translocase TatB [Ameyamaea chiangmaiensis NBRC 103196]
MFDFAWSEFALIGIVAIIFIGPKDLPVAIRSVTGALKKARRMASEFQTHVDDFVREADLTEVRDNLRDFRGGGIRNRVINALDGDRTIRKGLSSPDFTARPGPVRTEVPVAALPAPVIANYTPPYDAAPVGNDIAEPQPLPPPILPPMVARRLAADRARRRPPAFLPPTRVLHGGQRVAVHEGPEQAD